ncbi:MAG TPA: DNA mismatch repair endonuclease MutL [Longimicrobiales bacterium]|nr:DNA mismatch repair endonuclease MutL [Longimicrobiales bacterium]
MRRRIHILPDEVANQIAAGEVVERPASVVRELVENALDAGAGSVEVRIERGGKRRIRVTDDGAGMSREDAVLALDRHATSKIVSAQDLRSVRSFGFRGEALPSIAAVSRLRLETHDGEGEVGTLLRSTGGRILDVTDFPRRRGTTVEVQGLFFNAPARSAFLKSVSAETRACSEVVTTLALANPGVRLVMISDDRTLLDLPASTDLGERLARLWGEETSSTFVVVEATGGVELPQGYALRGVAQRPDAAQPGIRRGHLFVNGRPFRDLRLQKAVDRGYRTTIPYGARPWYVLYLEVPEGAVDVNVHPAKAEVRFREEGAMESLVEEAVRAALSVEDSSATFAKEGAPPRLAVGEPGAGWGSSAGAGERRGTAPGEKDVAADPGQMALFVPGGPTREGSAIEGSEAPLTRPERSRLWQLHNTYILAETRDGLLIIDQHSAHERVLFHRLMEAYGEGGQSAQRLLFPLTVRLTPEERSEVEDVSGILHRAGFEVEPFGTDTVIVHAVPNPHPYFDPERCFREMVAELTAGTSDLMRSSRNQHERIAMTFACKGAIKAGQRLSDAEMQELFDALFATELPHHDVHGRPTIVRLSSAELERKFGR